MREKETLQNKLKELQGMEQELCTHGYKDLETFRNVCNDVSQKLSDCKPTMMLYGVYNAGKSTLVNALFGEELAGVSDKPETSKITRYEFRGNIIYDTPGLNAPEEHEKVTMEHYKKCDMILFVLDTISGFEEQYIYDRIKEIVDDKKPLIIVLNDKAGLGLDSKEIQHVRQKIQINLAKVFPNGYSPLLVSIHAKSALKGEIENKQNLLKSSNIDELKHAILEIFNNTEAIVIFRTCCNMLSNLINDCKNGLTQSDSSFQSMQNMIDSLKKQHDDARIRCKSIIENTMYPLDTELINPILSGQQTLIEQCYNHRIQKVQEKLEQEFSEIIRDSKRIVGKFATEIATIAGVSVTSNKIDIEDSQAMDIILTQLKTAGAEQIAQMAKPAIELGLQGAKQLFPELMKGIGPVTMGKMAGKAVPVIGALTQIAFAAWEIWNAQKARENRIEQERAHAMEARQHATRIREQIVSEIFNETERVLKDCFETKLQNLQESIDMGQSKNAEQQQLRDKLENMLKCINDIQVKLTLQTPNQS